MGVCLGNQLIALSMGGKTEKMKYGHRGINHAVLIGNRVYFNNVILIFLLVKGKLYVAGSNNTNFIDNMDSRCP